MRIGVIGCGRAAAGLHLPALRRVPGVTVVALSDNRPDRLADLAARCPSARAYADYRALLADDRVDLVAVLVPASLHADIGTAALRAGKHLFVEKPLALAADEADRFAAEAACAATRGLRSTVGFNLRSHRLVAAAKILVGTGTLGEIELVRTMWTADWSGVPRPEWHATRATGGGALIEIGSHLTDIWRWLLDSEVERVQACSVSRAFDDQTVTVQARMTSGVLVSSAMSQRTMPHNLIEILGSRGSLRLSVYHGDSLEVTTKGTRTGQLARRLGPLLQRAARLPGALGAARGGGDFALSYARAWSAIRSAIASGGPMPATLDDGRRSLAVVLAALRSAAEGGVTVPVPAPASLAAEPGPQ
jgi:predicted dehydrogenase